MHYARWSNKEELAKILTPVIPEQNKTVSGIPMGYEGNTLYVNEETGHTLVIASQGSGKTQACMLPEIRLGIQTGKSLIVNDCKGELYELVSGELKERGYQTIILDLDRLERGNCWNPFTFPYDLYHAGKQDLALELVEHIAHYIFAEPHYQGDPFWINTSIDYFTGLVLYLFENEKKENITFRKIFTFSCELQENKKGSDISMAKELMDSLDHTSTIYMNLVGTLLAPPETKGSILSVTNQKLKKYISRIQFSNMTACTDFDFKTIATEKTAVFMISGISSYSSTFIPLFIDQAYQVIRLYNNKNHGTNIILDEFDKLMPIVDFNNIASYARGLSIRITAVIQSLQALTNLYGKEDAEIIKLTFRNIIYLLSNNIETLEEISKMCGNKEEHGMIIPLITVEELKMMNRFEAVILIPRMMPIKTKLLPDYQMNWNFSNQKIEIPHIHKNNISM